MSKTSNSLSLSNKLLIGIVVIATAYFLSIAALPKLIVTEEVYGDYYWFRASWLFIHVVAGLVGTLVGWYQFVPSFRNKNIKRHRIIGKVYTFSIAIAAITAVYLAVVSPGMDVIGKMSFAIIPLVWIGTISMGYIAIIKKRIAQHQEWMLRSYVVTFFFTIFVILTKYLPYEFLGVSYSQALVGITWFSWAVPFFITEIIIQSRKIF